VTLKWLDANKIYGNLMICSLLYLTSLTGVVYLSSMLHFSRAYWENYTVLPTDSSGPEREIFTNHLWIN